MTSRSGQGFPDLGLWPVWMNSNREQAPDPVMDSWPLVSLVTPSFNQGEFLEACIQSVLHQDYPNLEYFVLDGGSQDSSLSIIQKYERHLTGWSSKPDHGQADAVNQGWHRSSGKYLWWLNSDDLLLPGSLFISVSYLERHPDVDMVYGDILRIDRDGRITDRYNYDEFDLRKMLLEGLDIPQAGSLVRRAVIQEAGALDSDLHFVMDLEFWQRIGLAGKTIHHISEPLAMFRIYDESKTQAGSDRAAEERKIVAERVLDHPHCPIDVKRKAHFFWFSVHLACSRTWMKSGRFRQAIGITLRAVAINPRGLLEGRMYYSLLLSILGLILGWERWASLRARIRQWRRRQA